MRSLLSPVRCHRRCEHCGRERGAT
ncbi:MAG: hypothetical protein LBK67_01180 [Coriobacteriales bacterium]|nr:hypothetical protein [Coriobacteriales bacterium]